MQVHATARLRVLILLNGYYRDSLTKLEKLLFLKGRCKIFFFFLACHNFVFWFSKLTCAVCIHCPKNNHNLGIKVTPVTVGADAAGYLCLVSVSDILYCMCTKATHIPLHLLHSRHAQYSDYFFGTV